MICLKRATIGDLINLNYPLETVVYWVDYTGSDSGKPDIYNQYLDVAEKLFDVKKEIMTSNTRIAKVLEARNIVWTALYNIEKLSSISIGKLARKNHASVLNGVKSIVDRMDVDKALRIKYNAFCNSIDKEINSTFEEKFDYEKGN